VDNVGEKMARILDLDRKYQVLIIIFTSIFVALVILAITISNIDFKPKAEGSVAVILNDGDLVIDYVDGNTVNVGDKKTKNYGISLTNSSSNTIYYSLGFSEANRDALVEVYDEKDELLSSLDKELLTKKVLNLYSIKGGETVRFSVKIKADNGSFKGTMLITNESLSTQTFADILLLNNPVVSPKTRVGNEVATTNEGLIQTTDTLGTAYFFRGKIDNNYLKINDTYFRVVRINGDESVRVVLDGVIDVQGAYNTNDVGETYDSFLMINEASVYSIMEDWVVNNLSGYGKFLTDGVYCLDTNFDKDINGIKYSNTYERIYNDSAPVLTCNGSSYKSRIGMLSVDEVVLAGAYKNTPNDKYYLYNENIKGNYLTLSPYYINTSNVLTMMNVIADGSLGDGVLVTTNSYIRPVLNIGVNAKLKGEGTKENPYIIVS
jgi:hypothetical protein